MRISPTPRVCSGLLCSFLFLIAGCGNPLPQNLVSLTVTATPATVTVGGAAVLKAAAHLSDGTVQDVTAGTQWTLSNSALATMTSGALTAKAPGTVTVQAAYVETAPAGSSPASATVAPQNLTASTQVTITPASGPGAINVPIITWNPPATISYGTALSSTQLSATANVPGTVSYTPASGTVLKAIDFERLRRFEVGDSARRCAIALSGSSMDHREQLSNPDGVGTSPILADLEALAVLHRVALLRAVLFD